MKILFLILLLATISCGKTSHKKSSELRQDVSSVYQSSGLKISIYYEEGAEPYTDQLETLNLSIWDLFLLNLNALLEGRNITVTLPKTLPEMVKLPAQNKGTWKIQDVLDLAALYPMKAEAGNTEFQIFFLKGYAEEDSGIIGFHIDKTKTIAVFKNVINNSSNGDAMVPKYVEQATLIHEMGHALGLVNNPLAMSVDHKDKEHGAHCSNPHCVMYYMNEGAGSLIKFVQNIKNQKNLVMFDSHCLHDARNYKP